MSPATSATTTTATVTMKVCTALTSTSYSHTTTTAAEGAVKAPVSTAAGVKGRQTAAGPRPAAVDTVFSQGLIVPWLPTTTVPTTAWRFPALTRWVEASSSPRGAVNIVVSTLTTSLCGAATPRRYVPHTLASPSPSHSSLDL